MNRWIVFTLLGVMLGIVERAEAQTSALSNPSFERGLQGWAKTGTAFDFQPTHGESVEGRRVAPIVVGGDYWSDIPYPIGIRGKYWIGTAEKHPNATARLGGPHEPPTGTLTSSKFKVPSGITHITFLIGGSEDVAKLKLELLEAQGSSFVPVSAITARTGHDSELLRRDWWAVSGLDRAKEYVVRITDDSTTGHINVDDIRFEKQAPPDLKLANNRPAVLQTKIKGKQVWTDYDVPLWGAADLHTHLMSHLSMGKKAMHGAPDVGSLIPAGTQKLGNSCNRKDVRATSVAEALGDCSATHGGWGTDNECGNHLRAFLLNMMFDSEFESVVPMPHEAKCDSKLDADGGLCYPKCRGGFQGVGPMCHKLCPAGLRDDGLHCAKPAAYGRGVGYPATSDIYSKRSYGRGNGYSYDPFKGSLSNGKDRCRKDHPAGCDEGSPSIWYPKCRAGYKSIGLLCYENCRAGYQDDGLTCRADGLGAARAKCAREHPQGCEQNGALIYPRCRAGFHAVGCCTCSPDCPVGMTDIGVSCQKNGSYGRGVGKPPASNVHGDHPHPGYPKLDHWPHFSSRAHQQMYVDWIRRAHDGGLNVMVALAVNNHLLGEMVSGDDPKDDKRTADLQIDEIKSFVARHSDFMSVVLTAADFRRTIREGKLAVIVGVEVDNIGNFNFELANETTVKREIQRLYDKGVRYVFPVHFADNKFGGVAVYEDMTNLASRFARSRPLPLEAPMPPGLLYDIEGAKDPQITFRLGTPLLGGGTSATEKWAGGSISTFLSGVAITILQEIPWPPAFDAIKCPIPRLACIPQVKLIKNVALTPDPLFEKYAAEKRGHVNTKPITPLGRVAIKQMMQLGMIIDIDHMSEKMANEVLLIAKGLRYPVTSGHTTFRDHGGNNENKRTQQQLATLNALGGMMGVGWAGGTMASFLDTYRYGVKQTALPDIGFTLGSDINGFEYMPRPRFKKEKGKLVAANNNSVIADKLQNIKPNQHPPTASYSRRIELDPAITSNWNQQVCYDALGSGRCLIKYKMKGTQKDWDFNTDGVAHIGLYPDAYQDLRNLGMTAKERTRFFSAADLFARMWDTIEARKAYVR